ncbi:MAG: pyridoxal phosphate-dependent aminotransferase [Alphaproteobacteria bacterium]|nr:pyridoxal phosphate-dependent aminotransferase [Alphaproteobacteria bacterium]
MQNLQSNYSPLGTLSPSVTLSLAARAKELKKQGLDVYSMSVGEPDFDTPQAIKDAAIKTLNEGKVGYIASSGLPELKDEIVKKMATHGIKTTPNNVVVTTGAKLALFETITALCGKGDEVIVLAPYWLSYPEMIKASGAKMVVVNTKAENDFAPTKEDLQKAITSNTKLIIVNSPSNPTGAVYSKETLQMIADLAVGHNFMVLSDEIYEKLIYDNSVKHISIGSLNEKIAELTITINGFSKAYAMTGWRLGYLVAPTWLAKRISALQSHATSNATTFVQYAAIVALQGKADTELDNMVKTFARRRELLCKLLKEVPQISFIEPKGAFYVMCNISKTGKKAADFAQELLEQKLLTVIPCESFGAPEYVRLSYACSEEHIKEAIKRLKEFCSGL